jgi:hypothetical protein
MLTGWAIGSALIPAGGLIVISSGWIAEEPGSAAVTCTVLLAMADHAATQTGKTNAKQLAIKK